MDHEPRYLFVYGTLRPKLAAAAQRRLIASFTEKGPATVRGTLYDLGPYPGLVAGAGVVHGDLLATPPGTDLDTLDAYEECGGESPLYRREATVATRPDGSDVAVWAYFYVRPVGTAPAIAGGDYSAVRTTR